MKNLLSLLAKNLDLESFSLAVFSVLAARLISTTSTSPLSYLFSSFLALTTDILVGMKIATWLLKKMRARASSQTEVPHSSQHRLSACLVTHPHKSTTFLAAYSPILGLGFVYLVWMITATVSTFAPTVTISVALLCVIFPPQLHVTRFGRRLANSILVEVRSSRLLLMALIVQFSGMAYVSLVMITVGSSGSSWLNMVWDGLPSVVFAAIIIVIFVMALTSLTVDAPKTFLLQVAFAAIWIRSFMIFRGFVWTGGDGGEHVAVAKYLLNGGSTPFVALFQQGVWNWRYGSLTTLFFNSNYAFTSFSAGFSPDAAASALAVAFSSMLLIFGSYALSTCIFKSGKVQRICFMLLLFNTVDFFWQFRSDPNAFTHAMYPAYLASIILAPFTFWGFVGLFLTSFLMWATHPLSILLVAPAMIYVLVCYLRRLRRKHILFLFCLISGVVLFFVLMRDFGHAFVRVLSLQHLLYPRPGTAEEGFIIGNYISESSFLSHYLTKFYNGQLIFIALFVTAFLALLFRSRISMFLESNVRKFVVISILTIASLLSFDFFLKPSSLISLWRLWPLTIYLLIPSLPVVLLLITRKAIVAKRKINPHVIQAHKSKLFGCVLLFEILMSFCATMTYNAGNSLNFDTLSVDEYNLLSSFVSTVNLNDTIILAESPTMRYILAIAGDWLPSVPTYYSRYHSSPALYYYQAGLERIRAFTSLAYLSSPEEALRLAIEEKVSTVHIVVLNRLSGPKPGWWMKTAYKNPEIFGEKVLENPAGYILQMKFLSSLPLAGWNMTANGAEEEIYQIENETLILGGTFTSRNQAIVLSRQIQFIDLNEARYFAIFYRGDRHIGYPCMRVFLQDDKGRDVELSSPLLSKDVFTVAVYDLGELSIQNVTSVILSTYTGSTETPFTEGSCLYYVKNLSFLQ